MTHGNLIPVPIVDKNGRQTTVHRRMDRGGAAVQNIPPVLSPSLSKGKVEMERDHGWDRRVAANTINALFDDYGIDTDGDRWQTSLDALSDDHLSKLEDIAKHFATMLHDRRIRVGKDVLYVEDSVMDADTDAIDFYHRYREQTVDKYSYQRMDDTRSKLSEMGIRDPWSGEEPETLDAHIRAAMTYVALADDDDDEGETLDEMHLRLSYHNDERLIEYVEEHPDKVDDIMRFRSERNDSTFKDMEDYFEAMDKSGAPAVQRGWL